MAKSVGMDPDAVEGYAKDLWRIGDEMAAIRLESVLLKGAGACEGTVMVSGLRSHAYEQQDEIDGLADKHDAFGDWLKNAAEKFRRVDGDTAVKFSELRNLL